MVRIRGVRLFCGYADAGDDASVGPLREIVSLCGLTLGGDQTFDDGEQGRGGAKHRRQAPRRLKLATVSGVRREEYEQFEQVADVAKRVDQHGRGAL